jgi:LmbE family N-acetylglucosaminyl deacetylase
VRSLLLITAHPDDETFFAAGTIAKAAESGARVHIVCATRGERGATGGLCSIEELPQVREAELGEAARLLGISTVRFLTYQDQQLQSAPIEDVRAALVAAIRDAQPEVVITFDPNGANLHPDHVAIARFAADALSAAADPRWYADRGPAHQVWRVLWTPPIPVFKLPSTDHLPRRPGIDFLIDISRQREIKRAAISAHRTQVPHLRELFFDPPDSESILSMEAFRLGWGPRPALVPADDIFSN